MSKENEGCTWEVMESRLFENGVKLLETVLQASEARAEQNGSPLVRSLLHRADLAPRLVVEVSGLDGNTLTMSVLLSSRATGEPVARIFEIVAAGDRVPCLH